MKVTEKKTIGGMIATLYSEIVELSQCATNGARDIRDPNGNVVMRILADASSMLAYANSIMAHRQGAIA